LRKRASNKRQTPRRKLDVRIWNIERACTSEETKRLCASYAAAKSSFKMVELLQHIGETYLVTIRIT